MNKISTEISKKVVSLSSGNIVGYVIDVLFDERIKLIKGYLVADEESEEIFFLSYENVISQSDECFIINEEKDLEVYISSLFNNPIGKIVYDEKGLNLGRVRDVYFDKNLVKKIQTTKCEFPIQYLQKAGNDCVIYGRAKVKKKKQVLFEVKPHSPKVCVQDGGILTQTESKEFPVKLLAKTDHLIGKRLTQDLLGLNCELIAKKDEIVTKNIVQKAKQHNRYNLLMFYVK